MRYKEFNSNKVLAKCINLFWNSGFGGCAVNDIVNATNVNRFSLYEEFENKEGILLASMDLYIERHCKSKFEGLQKEGSLKDILYQYYMSFMQDEEAHPSGCYIIRIATELADNNMDVKSKLNDYLNIQEEKIVQLLLSHSETETAAKYLAKHLTGLFCSLTTFCVIHSYEERKSLVNSGISVLLKNHSSHATYA